MQKKSNRWLIWVLVAVALVALLGFSFGSLFDSFVSNRPSPTPTVPTPGATPTPVAVSEADKKNFKDIENGYLLILEKEPDNTEALEGLVEVRSQMVKIGLKQPQDLIDPLEKLVRLNPNQTRYSLILAQNLQQVGRGEVAEQTYRQILATQPGNMDALQEYVTFLIKQQRSVTATELLQTTLQNAPEANTAQPNSINVVGVKLLLGQVYASQKQFDQALSLYDALIANDVKDFRPVFAKAVLLKEQGKTKEAGILFNSAVKLAPSQYKDRIQAAAATAPSTLTPSVNSSSAPSSGTAPSTAPSPQ